MRRVPVFEGLAEKPPEPLGAKDVAQLDQMGSDPIGGHVEQHLIPMPLMLFTRKDDALAILLCKKVRVYMARDRRVQLCGQVSEQLSSAGIFFSEPESYSNFRFALEALDERILGLYMVRFIARVRVD